MRRCRRRSAFVLSAVLIGACALTGVLVIGSGVAGADTLGPVDATLGDGDTDSLRDVLETQAAAGDVVVLQTGATYVLDDCGAGDIDVVSGVTIQGNGATIRQTCLGARVLDAGDLTVQNTTVTGGRVDGEGGGIRSDGAVLLLQGV